MRITRRTGAGRIVTATTAVVALLVPATLVPSAAVADVSPANTARQIVQSGVDDLVELGVVGASARVTDVDRFSWARAGVGDRETSTPVPANGYFRMGSNTKTFAAVVVLQLVEEGQLTLDDPVEQWLPGVVTGNGNDGSAISVRHLLQHTSGLYDYVDDLPMFFDADEFAARRFDYHRPSDLVAIAMGHPPHFPPGQWWAYSNTNYVLVGMLIEQITGRSWTAALQQRILQPLELDRTFSPGVWPDLPPVHARGYHQFAPGGPLVDTTSFNPSVAYAAGDLVTTPHDLTRFWQALMRGDLLGPAMMAELTDTRLADTMQQALPGARYGLGVMWTPNSCGGHWGHLGNVPGVLTVTGASDDGDRVTVVVLTSQTAEAGAGHQRFLRTNRLVTETLCR